MVCVLAGPAAAAGGGATQDETSSAVRTADKQRPETVSGTTEERMWTQHKVRHYDEQIDLVE